jgi:hypothetical protein
MINGIVVVDAGIGKSISDSTPAVTLTWLVDVLEVIVYVPPVEAVRCNLAVCDAELPVSSVKPAWDKSGTVTMGCPLAYRSVSITRCRLPVLNIAWNRRRTPSSGIT